MSPAHPADEAGRSSEDAAPLRVLFVDYGVGFGGSIVSLAELVEGLVEEKLVTPLVIAFQPEEFTDGRFPPGALRRFPRAMHYGRKHALEKALSRSVLRLLRPAVMRCWVALDYLAETVMAVRLAAAGHRFGAELIHVNTGPERSGALAAKLLGVPLVTHMRRFPSLDDSSKARWLRRIDADIDHYFAVSTAVADKLVEGRVARRKITVIHNSVRLDGAQIEPERARADRQAWGIGDAEVVVGAFGRVTAWKGQLDLVEAASTIAAGHPQLKLMIVGDESDSDHEYQDAVHAVAEREDLRGRVVFTGYQHDVEPFYSMCDIIVHCSNRPEPFGRVVIEGMAAGKPTIAMAEGGPLDIVTDGVDGLLVTPRDGEALASAIRSLLDDPERRARLGAAGHRTVTERFSSANVGRRVARMYAEILAAAAAR